MNFRKLVACTIALTLALVALPGVLSADEATAAKKKVVVGWSVWTGWMPFKLMKEEGLLEKRAKEYKVDVELKEFKVYMDSVQAFSAGQLDGCTMTAMEALQPASSGVSTVAVLPNDVSNGGDGLLVRKGMKVADLKGQKVLLEEKSVSHYLLARALDKNNIAESEVTILNTPGDDAGKAFLTDDSVKAVVTWNPHLFLAQESGKGEVIFSSRDISGEIIDVLVFNEKTVKENPDAVQAVVMAWYDAMGMIADKSTRDRAISVMAEGAGTTPDEFKKMMAGTRLFTTPASAIEFFASDKLVQTMGHIKDFSAAKELITDKNFSVGYSANSKANLKFASTFVKKATVGKAGDNVEKGVKDAGKALKGVFGKN